MNQTILFYGDEEILRDVSKKGSETDIRYYNSKMGGNKITFLYPFKFPERIQTLVNASSVSNKAMLSVSELDKSVGEFLLTMGYHQIKELGLMGEPTSTGQVEKIAVGLGLKVHPLGTKFEDFEKFAQIEAETHRKEDLVVIDQSFSVKGVGTVSLGFVMGGNIKKHMELKAYPSGKTIDVKNIQIMDEDVESAEPFSRVGLAYRNAEVDDVPKGSILYSSEGVQFTDSIQLEVRTNPTVKIVPSIGDKIQLNFLFNNVNAEISDISERRYLIDVDKKIPLMDEIYSITSLNSSPRILGAGKPAD